MSSEASPRGSADDTSRARRGLTWTVGSLVVVTVAQVAYTSATARLVAPREFGYYASAQALAALAGFASLSSVGSAVMRHPHGRGLRRAALSLAGVSGLLAGAVVVLIGGLWAGAWGIDGAADAARLAGVCVAVSPLTAVMTGLQRRALRYRHAAAAELAGTIFGFIAGLSLALWWHNALALLAGQAIAGVVTALACIPSSRQPGTGEATVTWLHLAGFATNVSAQNFVYYVIYNLPAFGVARTVGAVSLGVYSRANVLVSLPTSQLVQAVSRVLYPLWARRDSPEQIRGPFTDVLVGASLVGTLGFGALLGAATPITRLLLGPAFQGVDDLTRILALFGILNLQFSISGSLQEASRWMGDVWRLQALKLVVSLLLVGMVVFEDARYAAGVLVAGQVLAHGRQLVQLRDQGVVLLRPVLVGYGQHAMLVAPPALALWVVTQLVDDLAVQVASTLVVAALVLALVAWLGDRLAGVGALDRRGLLPGSVSARLRERRA
jgi:O-antigen/teichoic acid export membrane protein